MARGSNAIVQQLDLLDSSASEAPEVTAPAKAPRKAKSAVAAPAPKVPELDRVIHERIRLGIISALAANEHVTFSDLRKVLDTTDGNLSVHARKLEEAGYVECTKSFEGRMPKTEYRLTPAGRSALTKYLSHMEALIQVARGGTAR